MADDAVREAVTDMEHNILMTSGAGCGKTYRMVERYVQVLRQGVAVSRIVAVTFTEKAAQELKGRVRERCRELADRGAEEGVNWQRTARRLEMAPIGTIHSFCARLLRENAVAAGVDPQFRSLDETEQTFLLRDTVRDCLLRRLHADEPAARALVAAFGLPDAQRVLRDLVNNRERRRQLLDDPPEPAELLNTWRTLAEQATARLVRDITGSDEWHEALTALESVTPADAEDKAAQRQAEFLAHALQAMDTALATDVRVRALQTCLEQGSKRVGAKKNWPGREDDLATVKHGLALLADLRALYARELGQLSEVEGQETAELAAAICREAAVAAEAYRQAKRERSALDFADLQILARDLLAGNPDVLRRCRDRYRHLLVDEFQDTNALQKEIIWLIAGGNVSEGVPPAAGRLFIVGDAKQSIYGFRGAAVSVFNETAKEFADDPACRVVSLDESRRSHPSLVSFHNSLFSHPSVMGEDNPDPYEASYEPLRAHRPPLADQPDVELLLVPPPEPVGPAFAPSELRRTGLEARPTRVHELREAEAEALAACIAEIVENGELTVCPAGEQDAGRSSGSDSGERVPRPASFGDFAILFAAMTDVGLYEAALRRRGVPFYTVAGRGFYARDEIRDCLSLLRVLENAADDLSLAAVLRSPFFGISDDSLFWLRQPAEPPGQAPQSLLTALRQVAEGSFPHQAELDSAETEKVVRAWETVSRLRACKNQMSISELVERLLADTGLTATLLTQFAGRQAVANLRKLTDLARSFEGRGQFSLREFIDYLGDLVVTEHHEGLAAAHEEAGDVVQLLTVHKAKGMQWPIVVVPDLSRSPRSSAEIVAASDELGPIPRVEMADGERRYGAAGQLIRQLGARREEAEARRLLYVALTRAEDHLILSSSVQVSKQGDFTGGRWLRWIAEALGLDPQVEDGTELVPMKRDDPTWTCVIRRPEGGAVGAGSGAGAPPGEPTRPASPRWPDRGELGWLPDALAADRPPLHGEEERLLRAIAPVPVVQPEPPRYSVTELTAYLDCPRCYQLRYVRDMPEAVEPGSQLGGLSPTERGTLAHEVMELIGRDGADGLERAIALAAFGGAIATRLSDAERSRLADNVRWFLETPQYRDWIADAERLRSEVPFAVKLDGAVIEGKIDALAEDRDGAIYLLDYKTGAGAEAELNPEYQLQMGLYCAAVQAATGSLPQVAALVYLDASSIEELEPEQVVRESLVRVREAIGGIARREFVRAENADCDRCALAYACKLA